MWAFQRPDVRSHRRPRQRSYTFPRRKLFPGTKKKNTALENGCAPKLLPFIFPLVVAVARQRRAGAVLATTLRMSYVLLVDDDSAVRRMIPVLLRSYGYETETADDGTEALSLMRQRRPRLVLLAISMPMTEGSEFRKHQLEDPALADIPVVCITSIVHPEDVERLLGIPCLRKPVDFPSLISAVEKLSGPPGS